ncbi:MAG: 3-hydroxyacyl-ACP dehydratase FabZ [Candidatus Omnitrophica bacterium]|nr:3-hydroxyacyl-ACP dehydratase FabZ [Candidatus Omnitrophota bacterium]
MKTLDIDQIKKVLPHRHPMLLIDRVIELEPGKRVVAIKNVSINDSFLQGHFPGNPIMPGTSIVEAMAQASIVLYHSGYEDELVNVPNYYLGSIKARFIHPVFPGDQLSLEAETVKLLPTGAFISTKAFVKDKQIAEAELVFAVKK